jgi:DNA-binding transcriptional MerR regulator
LYTIGRLAKKFHLSRSSLLYYDSIGLLKPSARTTGDYRAYSEEDARRLEQICVYRRAGLPLTEIAKILDAPESSLAPVLEARLDELNEEITRLRRQQHFIIGILQNKALAQRMGVMTKETWTSLLAASGFSQEDMIMWHIEFERHAPEKHKQFLEFIGLEDDESEAIRSWSADYSTGARASDFGLTAYR